VIQVDRNQPEQGGCVVGQRTANRGRKQNAHHLLAAPDFAKTARDIDGFHQQVAKTHFGDASVRAVEAPRITPATLNKNAVQGAERMPVSRKGFTAQLLYRAPDFTQRTAGCTRLAKAHSHGIRNVARQLPDKASALKAEDASPDAMQVHRDNGRIKILDNALGGAAEGQHASGAADLSFSKHAHQFAAADGVAGGLQSMDLFVRPQVLRDGNGLHESQKRLQQRIIVNFFEYQEPNRTIGSSIDERNVNKAEMVGHQQRSAVGRNVLAPNHLDAINNAAHHPEENVQAPTGQTDDDSREEWMTRAGRLRNCADGRHSHSKVADMMALPEAIVNATLCDTVRRAATGGIFSTRDGFKKLNAKCLVRTPRISIYDRCILGILRLTLGRYAPARSLRMTEGKSDLVLKLFLIGVLSAKAAYTVISSFSFAPAISSIFLISASVSFCTSSSAFFSSSSVIFLSFMAFLMASLPSRRTLRMAVRWSSRILWRCFTISRRRSSVRGGTGMRIILPSFCGFSPSPAERMAFSISFMMLGSNGCTVSNCASEACTWASWLSGISEP